MLIIYDVIHTPFGDTRLQSMFTSSGRFLTAQLLFGDACRRGRQSRRLGGLGAGG